VIFKPALKGIMAAVVLLLIYFALVSLISGFDFAGNQFLRFWYFIIGLAFGFGIQVGLYNYLKNTIRVKSGGGAVVVVTGATSTLAMVSCCTHYLVNLLPIIGVSGLAAFLGQYQIEFFGVGLVLNLIGIFIIGTRIRKFLKSTHAK